MTSRSWIRKLFARPVTRPVRRAPARSRLAVEALEDRAVPAGFQDLGFEQPGIGNYQYSPGGSPWTFTTTQNPDNGAGIAANGSGFGNANAPEGRQVAFLQQTGSCSQTADLAGGTYSISFWAAQRPGYAGYAVPSSQTFNVLVDGNLVGSYLPNSTGFQPFSTSSFPVESGSHTIEFVGTNTLFPKLNNTAFIDFITLNQAGPQPFTGAATSVSGTEATLHGSVNPLGSTATALIQYSTDPTFPLTIASSVGPQFQFQQTPQAVAVDGRGNVFVALPGLNAVYKILPDNTAVSIGSGFNEPWGVAADAHGNVFVADAGSNTVKKVLPDGTTVNIGSGFYDPNGVAVDAHGNVYVADTGNHAVKKIHPDNSVATLAPDAGFRYPRGVAVDAAGNVFVADTENPTVTKIHPDGITVETIGAGFPSPIGVAVDAAGNVFVADESNDTVKMVRPDGTIVVIGSGFGGLSGVAVDAAGNVYVTGSPVVKLSPPTAGTPVSASGSQSTSLSGTLTGLTPGTTYYYRTVASGPGGTVVGPVGAFFTANPPPAPVVRTGADGAVLPTGATLEGVVNPEGSTTTALFQYSTDPAFTPTVSSSIITNYTTELIAVDAAGNVFGADDGSNTITKVLPDGTTVTIASGFGHLSGVAVDASGNVYVADAASHTVYKVLPTGTVVTIASGFGHLSGVAVDESGNVYVTESGNQAVYKVQTDGTVVTIGSGFGDLNGVAVDASGIVYVVDDSAVKKVLHDGSIVTIRTGFGIPAGVAVDAHGNIYVTDAWKSVHAVYKIFTDGTLLTLFTDLSFPSGVAVDGAGNVYVADTDNHRVLKLSPTSVAATPSPLSGHQSITVSATATGLTPNTTYYYRAVASGPGGLVASDLVESFTTVTQFTTTVNWGTPAAITYGTPLDAAQLNATADLPGAFAYSPAAGTVLNGGSHTLSVTFTPSDPNYETVSQDVTLIVNQAMPTVNWAPPAAINYGTALGAAQLNATASVPGDFTYTPAAGYVLSADSQTLSVTFTPSDTANYTSATASVTLTVNQAMSAVSWATPAPITSGTALSDAQLNATADVPGIFAYTPAAGAVLSAGSQTLFVLFTPTDPNYQTVSDFVTLTVNDKGLGDPESPKPGAALVGSTLIITGSAGDDVVRLTRHGDTLRIIASFQPGGFTSQSFSVADVSAIDIDLGNGNDIAGMASPIRVPAFLDGGAGDDLLITIGGSNFLMGRDGNDRLMAYGGNNLLIGGEGSDVLMAAGPCGSGGSILIGGNTTHDANDQIMYLAMGWPWYRPLRANIGAFTDHACYCNGDSVLDAKMLTDTDVTDPVVPRPSARRLPGFTARPRYRI